MLRGIDISHWNIPDFSNLGEIKFIISKASEGLGKDSKFETNLLSTSKAKRNFLTFHLEGLNPP